MWANLLLLSQTDFHLFRQTADLVYMSIQHAHFERSDLLVQAPAAAQPS